MNQSEEIVIRKAISRLRAEGGASPRIKEALSDHAVRGYIDAYVIGALQCLLPESRDLKLAVGISS